MEPIRYRPKQWVFVFVMGVSLLIAVSAFDKLHPATGWLDEQLRLSPHPIIFSFLAVFVLPLFVIQIINNLYLKVQYRIPFFAFHFGFFKPPQLFEAHHTVPIPVKGYREAMPVAAATCFFMVLAADILLPSILLTTMIIASFCWLTFTVAFTWPLRKIPTDWMVHDTPELGCDVYPTDPLV